MKMQDLGIVTGGTVIPGSALDQPTDLVPKDTSHPASALCHSRAPVNTITFCDQSQS